jgi:hypothetical protein
MFFPVQLKLLLDMQQYWLDFMFEEWLMMFEPNNDIWRTQHVDE